MEKIEKTTSNPKTRRRSDESAFAELSFAFGVLQRYGRTDGRKKLKIKRQLTAITVGNAGEPEEANEYEFLVY